MPITYNSQEPQQVQQQNWTCSACSLAWLNRALHIDYATTENDAVEYIGRPLHINPEYGLMNASGARLVECLREQGAPAFSMWPSWELTLELARLMPMLLGGVGWYHWVGVRYAEGQSLILANSAPGWMGVWDILIRNDWDVLGPWAAVPVPLLPYFPPLPNA